jgi:hypothetical protein
MHAMGKRLRLTAILLQFLPLSDWVAASQLEPGDRLRLADDTVATVGGIRRIAASNGSLTTYNFTVADHHTYFVGRAGVWVHNSCPISVEAALGRFKGHPRRAGHTELSDFLDFHKKETDKAKLVPNGPHAVLDDNKFGMAAYKMATVALWAMVPTLTLVLDEGPGRSRQKVMDDMLDKTSAEALGLTALQTYLKAGGKARTQGGWDVHHIPEKWIWKDLDYATTLFPGLTGKAKMNLVPCIPLPGMLGRAVAAPGKPAWRSKWWCNNNVKALFGNNGFPFHGGSMDVNGVRTVGLEGRLKQQRTRVIPDPGLARRMKVNVYDQPPYQATPMGEVFKVFRNKVIALPIQSVP